MTLKKETMGHKMATPADYLKLPYGRTVFPESDGSFRAEIIEFPGCIATAETASEALERLEDVAASWLQSVIAQRQSVPEPMDISGFSGKLVVRLPKSLHRKASYMAARDGVSLNQFIVSSIAERSGSVSALPGVAPVVTQTLTTYQGVPYLFDPRCLVSSVSASLVGSLSHSTVMTPSPFQPRGKKVNA